MARLILFAVAVYALVWLLRRALEGHAPSGGGRAEAPRARLDAGDLVRCAQCGVHLPRSEARTVSGRAYCSDEHARLGPKAG
ncbi:MAG: PP0621 family protein [Betaproteobacteria bacterium]|nr:PP0621 family protein [Betaproteobacteria bacterium]